MKFSLKLLLNLSSTNAAEFQNKIKLGEQNSEEGANSYKKTAQA